MDKATKRVIRRWFINKNRDIIDPLKEKELTAARLRAGVRKVGKVAIHESGMDCDGCSYWGGIHWIAPSVYAYERLWATTSEWADGPFNLSIIPADEPLPERGSRDLGMEAFENGHPYSIRY